MREKCKGGKEGKAEEKRGGKCERERRKIRGKEKMRGEKLNFFF